MVVSSSLKLGILGMQKLLAASFWVGFRSRILAAVTATAMTAIVLFPIGGMPIAHQGLALQVRAIYSDGDH